MKLSDDWTEPSCDPAGTLFPGIQAQVRPSVARLYDCFLGGKDNREAERRAAGKIGAVFPRLAEAAWANRGFHGRAVVWMAEQGVRQFVDAGCGLPTATSTYAAVSKVISAAKVTYVDHDPVVVAHARALLTGSGHTSVVIADVRHPASLLAGLHLDGLIDPAEPVGLLVTAVMHFVADADDPQGCVARLVAALAPGSFLALSHASADHLTPVAAQTAAEVYAEADERLYLRSRAEIGRFFEGLEIVPPYPGAAPRLTFAGLWGCEDPAAVGSEGSRAVYCAVARKP